MKSHIEAKKAVVYIDKLLLLFDKCKRPDCDAAIDPDNRKVIDTIGAPLTVKYVCNNHHTGEWHSSPFLGEGRSRVGVLNVLLATRSLVCGLHITQVCCSVTRKCSRIILNVQVLEFFKMLNIAIFGMSFYTELHTKRLSKIIWAMWSDVQKTEVEAIKKRQTEGIEAKLAGDGRFDSRGSLKDMKRTLNLNKR